MESTRARGRESHGADTVAALESTGGALAAPAGTGFERVGCTGDNCSDGSDGEKTSEAGEHSVDREDDVGLRGDWVLVGWWWAVLQDRKSTRLNSSHRP